MNKFVGPHSSFLCAADVIPPVPPSSPSASSFNYHSISMRLSLWLSCLFMLVCPLFSPRLCFRSSSHPSVLYHYYEPKGPDECSMYLSHERSRRGSHHCFITEKRVFANWAQTLNIHFYQPDWKPSVVSPNSSDTLFPVGP